MKKLMKKFLSLFVLIFIFIITSIVLYASDKDESLSKLYRETSRNEIKLSYDVNWINIIAETQTTKPAGNVAGYGSTGKIELNKWYGQQINLLEVPRITHSDGSQKYEVVAWSIQGDQSWDFSGVTEMASDFEKKNPGYIVLGGINGDFYDWHTTLDYPNSGNGIEMSNGEFLRSIYLDWGVVGVKNNGELNQLVFADSSNPLNISTNFYLSIYDNDGKEIKEIELNGINLNSLNDGETSAYFGSLERVYKYTIDENGNKVPALNQYGEHAIEQRIYHTPTLASGNAYYVIDGEKVIYQAAENSYYGKGQITNVNDSSTVVENSFAIVTKNPEIEALLAEDVTIRVQRKFIGDFAGIENALGCSHPLIENGVFSPYYASEDYYTTRAPRTIIGCKADGTICLLTMDGRNVKYNYYGTNQEEINAILQELEITDAYLLDGGGSSTFFVRENNKFIVKNQPSDGAQRSVSNGFLIVSKIDQSIKTKSIETSNNSVTIEVETNNSAMKKAYVECNNDLYEIIDNKVTINNLSSNTKYDFIYLYKENNDELISCTYFENFQTDKITPKANIKEARVEDGKLYLELNIEDPEEAIYLIFCEINGKKKVYSIDKEKDEEFFYALPDGVEEFTCNIKVNYQLNTEKGNQSIDLEYVHKIPEEPKGGCGNGGIYYLSSLIACGCLLLLLKNRK